MTTAARSGGVGFWVDGITRGDAPPRAEVIAGAVDCCRATAAMSEDGRLAETIPAPADLPQCGACGTSLAVGHVWRPWPDLGLEITECGCGSTVSRIDPAAEHLRDELDDIRDEERAERHRERADGPGRW